MLFVTTNLLKDMFFSTRTHVVQKCNLDHGAYTLHIPRHFLPEVAAARGKPGTCQCEIGRWSQSVAQLASLTPETNMVRKNRDRAARLLDLYAKNNATQRPLAILNRQMGALRTYYTKCGPGNLPLYGGLNFLKILKKTGGPHED